MLMKWFSVHSDENISGVGLTASKIKEEQRLLICFILRGRQVSFLSKLTPSGKLVFFPGFVTFA
jgi:hypothetical protein